MAGTAAITLAEIEELEAVTWELERRGLVRPDYGAWLERARPDFRWDYRHFRAMQAALDKVTAGASRRVIFQVPIRHGKSEHNTIGYGTYRLDLDPSFRWLVVSHNEKLAHKFSRSMRRLAKDRGVAISPTRDTAGEWETSEGGGVTALGIGAGTASINADGILIDDPIGNRAAAESEAARNAVWDALTNDVLARALPHTVVLITMSRWHQKDPVGRILDGEAGEGWDLVDLPALAEPNDPIGRAEGEALWPEVLTLEWLKQRRAELGAYGFASLMQGRPAPRGGGMFQWDWWRLLEAVPASGPMVRYWDLAGTDATGSNDPDYTAGALLCRMPDARTAIVDIQRFRLSVHARDARILEIARADRERYGDRVRWWFEQEAGIAGTERTATLMRTVQNVGIPCYAERPTGSKQIRAEPLASKAEAGNVCLCPGAWRDPFRVEAATFPGASHDDQVDAVVGADAKLSGPAVTSAIVSSPWG